MARILFVVNHFYPELGAVRTEFEIAKELAEKGNDVLVITTFPRRYRLPPGYKYCEPKISPAVLERVGRLKILRIKSFKSRFDQVNQRFLELASSLVMLFLASFPLAPFYDVIMVAGDIELVVSQIGLLSKITWNKPVIVILHDIHPDTLIKSGVLKSKFMIRLSELLIRTFSRWVDKVIVHSLSNAEILSARYNMGKDKIEVVELWANIEDISRALLVDKRSLKEKYLGGPDKFVVTFAGVMNPPQGLEVVIHASRYIKDRLENNNITFLLVGDGMEKKRLIKLTERLGVNDMVKFMPLQPRDKYLEILRLSDACLVTLRKDYLQPVVPSKLLEIMAIGCPAVLSMPPHSDAVKIVKNYRSGLYAGNGDPEKLAKAILQLYNDQKLRMVLGENGREAVEKYYNLARAVNQYQKLLKQLSLINKNF